MVSRSAASTIVRGCWTAINKRSSLRTRTIRDAVRYGAAFARRQAEPGPRVLHSGGRPEACSAEILLKSVPPISNHSVVVRGSANFPVAEKYSEHGNRRPAPRDSQKHRHFIFPQIGSSSSHTHTFSLDPPPPPNSYPLLTEHAAGRPPEWRARAREPA